VYADLLISIAAHRALAQAVPHSIFVAELFGKLQCAEAILFRRSYYGAFFATFFETFFWPQTERLSCREVRHVEDR
jgi:hypothetical protein